MSRPVVRETVPGAVSRLLASVRAGEADATGALVSALGHAGLLGDWATPDRLLRGLAGNPCGAEAMARLLWATMPYRTMLGAWTDYRDAAGDLYLARGADPAGILPGTGWSDPTTPFGSLVRRLLRTSGAMSPDLDALPVDLAAAWASGGRREVERFLAEADFLVADEAVLTAVLAAITRDGTPHDGMFPSLEDGRDRVGDALYVRGLATGRASAAGWRPPGERDPYVARVHDSVAEPFDRVVRKLVLLGPALPPRRDLARFVVAARHLARLGRFAEIDDAVANMHLRRMHPVTVVRILRTVGPYRAEVRAWDGARDVAGDGLSRRAPGYVDAMARIGWVPPKERFEDITRLILGEAPDPSGRRDRVDHMVVMQEILRLGRHAPVDAMLARADAGTLPEADVIHLVRSTFSARAVLPSWEAFRDAAGDRFEREGRDAGRVMTGLGWLPPASRRPAPTTA